MNDLKFQINKDKFYAALQIASRAISSNSPVPALAGIKVEATETELKITGSNASITTFVSLSNEKIDNLDLYIERPGVIVLDAKYLLDIVRKMDSMVMTVEIIDGTLIQFLGNKANFKMNGFQPSSYPPSDSMIPTTVFDIETAIFKEAIEQTICAVSTKTERPVLTGLNFNADGEQLVIIATDSFRLARKTLCLQTTPFNITVPAKVLSEVRSVFEHDETIHISLDSKHIKFESENMWILAHLLEGGFPNVGRLVPTQFSDELIMDKIPLMQSIDRASIYKTDSVTNICLTIDSSEHIEITSKDKEIGSFKEDLSAIQFEGNPFKVTFAAHYLRDAAKAFKSDHIRLQFTGQFTPFIVTEENGDGSLLQLILPVRTSD